MNAKSRSAVKAASLNNDLKNLGMQFVGEILRTALVMPDYRDWSLSWEIIKARLKLLALLSLLCVVGVFTSLWLFLLISALMMGLAIAVGFDLFFASGMEGGRRLRKKIVGAERSEAKRLEGLAKLDYNGLPVSPVFLSGLSKGLWLEIAALEKTTGKRIAPSVAVELGQAKTLNKQRWIPSANAANVTRSIEPVGQQFFSIWLEKTAIPFWRNIEQEAIASASVEK